MKQSHKTLLLWVLIATMFLAIWQFLDSNTKPATQVAFSEFISLAKAPDEALDPLLRIYSKILRVLERGVEADALDERVKDALFRKADREGRLPSPVKFPGE